MKNILKSIIITAFLFSAFTTASMADTQEKADTANGAMLWASICVRCHNVRAPEDISKRAWRYSMQHMRVRAGLTGKETRDILAFITSSKTSNDYK